MAEVTAQSDVTEITWVNGLLSDQIAIADRGLAYGDGLFETMRYQAGNLPLLPLHIARLTQGAERLNIPVCIEQVHSQLKQVMVDLAKFATGPFGALKLIVTRGAGVGYRPNPTAAPNYYWLYRPCAESSAFTQQGVSLQLSPLRLSRSPYLGGLKHLNRLEYVLAAQQGPQQGQTQLLLLDEHECVVEGLTHNIFWLKQGELCTPDLSHSGVAGVMRQWILKWADAEFIPVQIGAFSLADLLGAQEVFLCNSLRGIWPVVQIQDAQSATTHKQNTQFNPGPITRRLQGAVDSLWQTNDV